MRRRQLMAGLGLAAVSATISTGASVGARAAQTDIIRPPRLRPGDTVAIISPAGATFTAEEVDIVADAVRGLGLVPRIAPHALARYGYLAGTDAQRAADLHQMFADPTIAALLPVRGDWGSARLLPYLDFDLIRRHPKVLVGFSDLTALLLAVTARSGLVTFHGPNGLTAWRDDQVQPFRQLLFEAATPTYRNPLLSEDASRLMAVRGRTRTLRPGRVTGPLLGGNLSVLSGIVGSPYLPGWQGAILFLEDVGEPPYRIDRMLTQLKLAGILEQLGGFVFGQCTRCGPGADYGSLTLEEILDDHIAPLNIPAYSGAWIGHVEPMWTLPVGLPVTLDAAAGTLQLSQPAVV